MWWINIGCKSPALSRPLLTIDGEKVQVSEEWMGRLFDQWGCFGIELVIWDNNHGHRDPFSIKAWRKCEGGVGGVGECEGEGGGEVELAGRGAVCCQWGGGGQSIQLEECDRGRWDRLTLKPDHPMQQWNLFKIVTACKIWYYIQ